MSHYDRSPYAPPTEPPLTINQQAPARGGGPAPVTLVISVVLLIAAAGGVFVLYRGAARPSGGLGQPVGAPIGAVKIPAPPQAQPDDPSAGLSIYRDTGSSPATGPAFVPPPEQPTPRPTAAAAPAAPAPVSAVPPTPKPAANVAPPPAALPVTPVPAPAAEKPKAATKLKPETKPAPATIDDVTSAPQASAEPPAAPGGIMVQIGAFSSADQADKGWSAAAGVAPGAMAGKGKKVQAVAKGGATLYRTSITGFSSKEEAKALCDKLQAAGKSCFVK